MTMIGRVWDSTRMGGLGKWALRPIESNFLTIAIKLIQSFVPALRLYQLFS
jgi:hypothetical protein